MIHFFSLPSFFAFLSDNFVVLVTAAALGLLSKFFLISKTILVKASSTLAEDFALVSMNGISYRFANCSPSERSITLSAVRSDLQPTKNFVISTGAALSTSLIH